MMKKCLSLLLVLAMLLSVLPMGVFAEAKPVVFDTTDGPAAPDEGGSDPDPDQGDDNTDAQLAISADGRSVTVSGGSDGLLLTAIYDLGGTRLVKAELGSSLSLDDTQETEGECVARAFLLEEDTLIPMAKSVSVSMGELKVEETPDETTEPSEPDPSGENTITAQLVDGVLQVGGRGKLEAATVWPESIDLKTVKSVKIDSNATIESIEPGAFDSFVAMTDLDIGGVKAIEADAFKNCSKLKYLTLQSGKLESISAGAFPQDDLDVTFKGDKEAWEKITVASDAFAITTITLNNNVKYLLSAASEDGEVDSEETNEAVPETAPEVAPKAETPAEDGGEEPEEEEASEQLALEQAVQDGYAVVPEGAQMDENGTLDQMAAFAGKTTKGKDDLRVSNFSGLMPYQEYILVVTKLTGVPTGEDADLSQLVNPDYLVYAAQATAGAEGTLSFSYHLTTNEDVLIQVYGLANKRSIQLYAADGSDLDNTESLDEAGNPIVNLTLKTSLEDKDYTLKAVVQPKQWAGELEWSVSPEGVVEVENGKLTVKNAGTAYVKATVKHGVYEFSATCRVTVVNDEAQELKKVTLRTTSATTELYRTEGTVINIYPEIGNKVAAQSISTYAADEDTEETSDEKLGHLIQKAEFAPVKNKDGSESYNTMNDYFELRVVDDWTLRLVPTRYAVDHPSEVKTKYTSKLVLTVLDDSKDEGIREITTEQTLTLNVKKSTPKLTATAISINGFYEEKTYQIAIKGATATRIDIEEAHAGSWPKWLDMDEGGEGQVYVNSDTTTKTANATAYLTVDTQEWAIPATVKLSVKLFYQAPALRLSASSVTMAAAESTGAVVKLVSQDKTKSLEALEVDNVVLPDSFDKAELYYNKATGELRLQPNENTTAGTFRTNVIVSFKNTGKTVSLPLTIYAKTATMKLSKTTVTLNTKFGDTAVLKMSMTPSDAKLLDIEKITTERVNGRVVTDAEGALTIDESTEGQIGISTNAATLPSATYRVTVKPAGQKAIVVTVKTLAATTKPTMTLKYTGSLDLTYPEKGIKLTKTFRNITFDEDVTYKVRKNNGAEEDFETYFQEKTNDKGEYILKSAAEVKSGDRLMITAYAMVDGKAACSASVTVTVKRTAIQTRLSKSTLTMNRDAGQTLKVSYSFTPNGTGVKLPDEPKVTAPAELKYKIDKDSKTIAISLNESAQYGKTYKVTVKASDADTRTATLSVQVASKRNSQIKYRASVSGGIDPIRDASKATLTYSVSNYNYVDSAKKSEPVIKIMASADGKTYDQNVTEQFNIELNTKKSGQYFITKVAEETLDTTLKYRVEVDMSDADKGSMNNVIPATATLKVAPGSASVKTDRTVSIYKKDQTATYKFRVYSSDKKLNNVERVTVYDSKLQDVYQLVPLGEGYFELRLTGANLEKVKTGSLKLNVFVRGMEVRTRKSGTKTVEVPNTTVTLKLSVK